MNLEHISGDLILLSMDHEYGLTTKLVMNSEVQARFSDFGYEYSLKTFKVHITGIIRVTNLVESLSKEKENW